MTAVDGPMTADQVASCVVRHDHLTDGSTSDGLDCHPAIDRGSVPHYPTSAELAAFRRSYGVRFSLMTDTGIHYTSVDAIHPTASATWAVERSHGIGYCNSAYRDAHDASRARKGARLIRSGMAVAFCGNRP